MKTICFVCGAPRSGTTLICDLLEGHRQIAVFPGESKLYFYWNCHKPDSFFQRDYLFTNEVLSLRDAAYKEQFLHYVEKLYKVKEEERERKCNFSVQGWVNKSRECSLKDLYLNLFSCTVGLDRDVDVYVVKCPLYNEMGAIELWKSFGDSYSYNVRFLHMQRKPHVRYLSAKMRRKHGGVGVIDSVDGYPFPVMHAGISSLSYELSQLNKQVIGNDYLVMDYEYLVTNRETAMRKTADFFGVTYDDTLTQQVHSPHSTFGRVKGANKREVAFQKNTSFSERNIISFLNWRQLGLTEPIDLGWKDFVYPFKFENPLDYWANRRWMARNFRGGSENVKRKLFQSMFEKFNQGEEIQD